MSIPSVLWLSNMPLDILITVAVSSFIQSIFGVGVLLFGTPLLMLQGYNFFSSNRFTANLVVD
jgi:hypothetical protein